MAHKTACGIARRCARDPLYKYGVGKPFRAHGMIDHRAGQYALPDGTHSNTVESAFSLLKRGIMGTFHNASRKHLHRYVADFDFRWNARKLHDRANGTRDPARRRQAASLSGTNSEVASRPRAGRAILTASQGIVITMRCKSKLPDGTRCPRAALPNRQVCPAHEEEKRQGLKQPSNRKPRARYM